KNDLETAIHEFDCAQQMLKSFLVRDPTDKQQVRLVWIDAVALESVGRIDLPILVQVDSVVDHVHACGIHIKQSLDVTFGLARNSNDRVRHFQRSLLNPKREIVTAGELFAFPGSKRLERVNCDHERNSVILFRQDPAEMTVPRVTMRKVGVDVCSVEV